MTRINELITFKNSQGISVRGTLLNLSQNYIVFETYNPYSIVQLSEVLESVKICRLDDPIYIGRAVVSNLINTGLLLIVSITLVDPWSEKNKSNDPINCKDEAKKFIYEWNQLSDKIPSKYQLSVNKMRLFLMETNRWVEQFNSFDDNDGEERQSINNFADEISDPFLAQFGDLLQDFENEAKNIDSSSNDICKRFSQKELHSLIMRSPFMHRTFHKPLGYAGDYEMVNMMLRDPYEGETVYAKLLNLFFLKVGPAEAHRNRIDILLKTIKDTALKISKTGRKVHIFNFACGPAIEIQQFIEKEEISENCCFTLLDFSKDTLVYTQNALETSKQKSGRKEVELKFIHKSAYDVLRHSVGLSSNKGENESFDLVYCAGLFDYLSDKICSRLLKLFFHQLKSEGMLLATNVDSSNPVKFMMEYLMDWYLVYRNKQNFSQLIDDNIGKKQVYSDKTGYNIFLEIQKPSDST